MPPHTTYGVFKTPAGWVAAMASERGLARLTLPCATAEAALQELGNTGGARRDESHFTTLQAHLAAYFSGQQVCFADIHLDLSAGTPFQQTVWEVTRHIPYGQTRSYGEVAAAAGRPGASRAVGQALGRNPVAIIVPCHRVIASGGRIGGFGGGLELKSRLLELEESGWSV